MNQKNKTSKIVLAALFLALAYLIPFLTGQIPKIGSMLCPMHLPVLLCGFICGGFWGLIVGAAAPILRSLILGLPVFFPMAVCMAFELAAYGALAGVFHRFFPKKKGLIYASLLLSMVIGRLIWGAAMFLCVGARGGSFPFSAFLAGAFTNAIPGIILQLVLIPPLVILLEKLLRKRQ